MTPTLIGRVSREEAPPASLWEWFTTPGQPDAHQVQTWAPGCFIRLACRASHSPQIISGGGGQSAGRHGPRQDWCPQACDLHREHEQQLRLQGRQVSPAHSEGLMDLPPRCRRAGLARPITLVSEQLQPASSALSLSWAGFHWDKSLPLKKKKTPPHPHGGDQ